MTAAENHLNTIMPVEAPGPLLVYQGPIQGSVIVNGRRWVLRLSPSYTCAKLTSIAFHWIGIAMVLNNSTRTLGMVLIGGGMCISLWHKKKAKAYSRMLNMIIAARREGYEEARAAEQLRMNEPALRMN